MTNMLLYVFILGGPTISFWIGFWARGWLDNAGRKGHAAPYPAEDCGWCRLGNGPCTCEVRCPISGCQPQQEWQTRLLSICTPEQARALVELDKELES